MMRGQTVPGSCRPPLPPVMQTDSLADPLSTDYVAGEPVRTRRPVVPKALYARLQRDHVSPCCPRHREYGRVNLQYLADPVGVCLAERVLENELVAARQSCQVAEALIATGVGVTEPVACYIAVGSHR